ncbi:intraflagellar transport protein 80-like [Tropilaelaps mercedesae]|uniref:Intraflagellar transport protein 80-like n=1 Tax=Tropilaelaps mercedesae TaxID=418985 RepID=A0A1V9Y061_9ACAR|nr:intraflagellar transport protein 80-like [Tropilaelaps mercedesae]
MCRVFVFISLREAASSKEGFGAPCALPIFSLARGCADSIISLTTAVEMSAQDDARRSGRKNGSSHLVGLIKLLIVVVNIFVLLLEIALVSVAVYLTSIDKSLLISNLSHNVYNISFAAIIVGGLFVILFTVFGIIGTIQENRCFLTVYFSMMFIIVLGEVGAIAFTVNRIDSIRDLVKINVYNSLRLYSTSVTITNGWDLFQNENECCGMANPDAPQSEAPWKAYQQAKAFFNYSVVPHSCCSDTEHQDECMEGASKYIYNKWGRNNMRLKSVLVNGVVHEGGCSGVAWRGDASLVSCGEDHAVRCLRPDLDKTAQEERRYPDDVFPTGIYAVPSAQKTEIVLITCSDGKYRLASKANQRVVEAHTGAILSAGWNHDGTMLATAGEDGLLRLWMRNGAFKANLAEHESPVTCVCWSIISDELVYSVADSVCARPLNENRQTRLWRAHASATVTAVALSIDGIIVSGGEDCRFKLWDFNTGKNLYAGGQLSQPVNAVAWAPSGEVFAVASFETLTLCHKSGYTLSMDYPSCATIRALCWSDCGTQLAGACSNGALLIAHLVDRVLEWNNFEVSTVGTKLCLVIDVNMEQGIREELTFQGQSAGAMSFRHGVLVVATNGGVFIFGGTGQWQRPSIVRPSLASPVKCIHQSKGHLALVDSAAIHVYANNGKLMCTIRHPFLRANIVRLFDLNDEVVVLADNQSLQFFNINTGKQLSAPFEHERAIYEVAIEQQSWPEALSGGEHLVSFIDSLKQLHLLCLRGKQAYASYVESQVLSMMWSETSRQLAALRESQLLLWECPWAFNIAPKLLDSCRHVFPLADVGTSGRLEHFTGAILSLRVTNGAMHTQAVPPYNEKIEKAVDGEQWDAALKIARFFDVNILTPDLMRSSETLNSL